MLRVANGWLLNQTLRVDTHPQYIYYKLIVRFVRRLFVTNKSKKIYRFSKKSCYQFCTRSMTRLSRTAPLWLMRSTCGCRGLCIYPYNDFRKVKYLRTCCRAPNSGRSPAVRDIIISSFRGLSCTALSFPFLKFFDFFFCCYDIIVCCTYYSRGNYSPRKPPRVAIAAIVHGQSGVVFRDSHFRPRENATVKHPSKIRRFSLPNVTVFDRKSVLFVHFWIPSATKIARGFYNGVFFPASTRPSSIEGALALPQKTRVLDIWYTLFEGFFFPPELWSFNERVEIFLNRSESHLKRSPPLSFIEKGLFGYHLFPKFKSL